VTVLAAAPVANTVVTGVLGFLVVAESHRETRTRGGAGEWFPKLRKLGQRGLRVEPVIDTGSSAGAVATEGVALEGLSLSAGVYTLYEHTFDELRRP